MDSVKVFSDQKNHRKSFIISLAIVMIPASIGIVIGISDFRYLFLAVGIFMLSFILLIIISYIA